MAKQKEKKTKETILKAAIDEFIEYGFYGARMQRIADSAKVNKAMIHYYYSGKEKVYEEVLKTVFEYILDKLNAISGEEAGPEKKIEQIIDAYIDVFINYNQYMKLVFYEIIRGGGKIFPLVSKNFLSRVPVNPVNGKLYKYFRAQARAGRIRNLDPIHLFISIVAQVAPVYFVKDTAERAAGVLGADRMMVNKFVKERKKFVIKLLAEGIYPEK